MGRIGCCGGVYRENKKVGGGGGVVGFLGGGGFLTWNCWVGWYSFFVGGGLGLGRDSLVFFFLVFISE